MIFFFGEHNDNLKTRLSNKKMVVQLSVILAVKSKLAELGQSDCFSFCWRLLNGDVCSLYPGLQERGWGGGGGALTRVSINFDPRKKISHP